MSAQRKKFSLNETIKLAHERKLWVQENQRIERMEREAYVSLQQKNKRQQAKALLASVASMVVMTNAGFQFN